MAEEQVRAEQNALKTRLAAVRRRMEQAYNDKLDGKIAEEFWVKKQNDWQVEERQILSKMQQSARPAATRTP